MKEEKIKVQKLIDASQSDRTLIEAVLQMFDIGGYGWEVYDVLGDIGCIHVSTRLYGDTTSPLRQATLSTQTDYWRKCDLMFLAGHPFPAEHEGFVTPKRVGEKAGEPASNEPARWEIYEQ